MGVVVLRASVFSSFGRGHDQQRRPGRRLDDTVCPCKRRIVDGRSLVMAALARARLRPMGHTPCGAGAVGQLGLGVVDGAGKKHRALASEPLNRDCPLGGTSCLRGAWRTICGHFVSSFVGNSGAITPSRSHKLTRNSPRHARTS